MASHHVPNAVPGNSRSDTSPVPPPAFSGPAHGGTVEMSCSRGEKAQTCRWRRHMDPVEKGQIIWVASLFSVAFRGR